MSTTWMGDEVTKKVESELKVGLAKAAEMVLTKSKEEVPVETGALLRSGTVNASEGGTVQTISYNTPYALAQHEGLDNNHPNGGNAKYLEQPFEENSEAALKLIAAAAAKAFR